MLYAGATVFAAVACIYLLFRRANAFSPDVTPPKRLRKWAVCFFAAMALGHLWWIPSDFVLLDNPMLSIFIAVVLDCLVLLPTVVGLLLSLLQDKHRPVWPSVVASTPLLLIVTISVFQQNTTLLPLFRVYFLLLVIAFMIYMVRGVRQYGRWLRENYADLEHKEVWQSLLLLTLTLLAFAFYDSGIMSKTYNIIVQLNDVVLVGLVLWRVETLSSLTIEPSEEEPADDSLQLPVTGADDPVGEKEPTQDQPSAQRRATVDVAQLLKQHCEDTQLYLQYDLTLSQLAAAIGTNRTYLGEHFSEEGITYNTYINRLRIQHFVSVYRESVSRGQRPTALSLAQQCGFKSYSTFGAAFKQIMGQTVTAWMKENND